MFFLCILIKSKNIFPQIKLYYLKMSNSTSIKTVNTHVCVCKRREQLEAFQHTVEAKVPTGRVSLKDCRV